MFAADEKKLRRLDVALGPCVAIEGQRRPLSSPLDQDGNETPEQSSALFTVLSGAKADDALRLVSSSGLGRLFACSDAFVNAMAEAVEVMLATANDEDFAAEQNRISDAWMKAAPWPKHYLGLQNRLHRLGLARQARAKGLTLYFWFGPAVAMRTVVRRT